MVTWDPENIVRGEQKLAWQELRRVKVLTTDEGPFGTDFYFVLEGEGDKKLVIGQDEAGALLGRLQELPGFNNEAFIDACGSTATAEFLCWTAP